MADASLPDDEALVAQSSIPDCGSVVDDVSRNVISVTALPQVAGLRVRGRKYGSAVPVVLVDRSPLLRAGLQRALGGSRFRVAADYASLEDVPAEKLGETACIVIVGADRDVDSVLRSLSLMKERHRELRIVFLRERLDPGQLVAAIEAGVGGYLLRDEVSPNTILKSLEMVLADGIVVPPGFAKFIGTMARRVIPVSADVALPNPRDGLDAAPAGDAHPDPSAPAAPVSFNGDLARLSERERLILTHLTQGASNKQIARSLDVAETTIKAHIKSLLRKLRISNRTQAAMWAVNQGRTTE